MDHLVEFFLLAVLQITPQGLNIKDQICLKQTLKKQVKDERRGKNEEKGNQQKDEAH